MLRFAQHDNTCSSGLIPRFESGNSKLIAQQFFACMAITFVIISFTSVIRRSFALAKTPQISDAEWEVMKVLWERGPLDAQQIVDAIAAPNNWNPRTVKTLLNRLVKKNALAFEVAGRHYVYRPKVAKDACVRRETRSFLSRV